MLLFCAGLHFPSCASVQSGHSPSGPALSVDLIIYHATEYRVSRCLRFIGRPFAKRFAVCYRTVVCSVCLSCPACL